MKESLVEFNQVSFSFKNQNVLDNFSFSIPGNQWLAMVGVNGAGKSTLLKLALGLLKPNDGHVKVLGQPAGEFSTKPDVGGRGAAICLRPVSKVRCHKGTDRSLSIA